MTTPEPLYYLQSRKHEIDILLEQYHNNTEENKDLPYFKWIPYNECLPLDNNEPILIYDTKFSRMYDSLSYIGLQNYLWYKWKKYDNAPSHWMRIKKPESE